HIYHETTAPLLVRDLAGVLPGGSGIRTDDSTYAMLADLRSNVDRLHGASYGILVDGPGWWCCSTQRNPLPSDYPNGVELDTKALQTRFTAEIVRQRGETVFLVQKSMAIFASQGFVPVERTNSFFGAVAWARQNLTKESETRYWAVYR